VQITYRHAQSPAFDGINGLRNGQCFHRSSIKRAQERY
jgi:hypothetical protein